MFHAYHICTALIVSFAEKHDRDSYVADHAYDAIALAATAENDAIVAIDNDPRHTCVEGTYSTVAVSIRRYDPAATDSYLTSESGFDVDMYRAGAEVATVADYE